MPTIQFLTEVGIITIIDNINFNISNFQFYVDKSF